MKLTTFSLSLPHTSFIISPHLFQNSEMLTFFQSLPLLSFYSSFPSFSLSFYLSVLLTLSLYLSLYFYSLFLSSSYYCLPLFIQNLMTEKCWKYFPQKFFLLLRKTLKRDDQTQIKFEMLFYKVLKYLEQSSDSTNLFLLKTSQKCP